MNATTATTAPTDPALSRQISTALERSPHVPGRQLRFEAAEGRVVLRGVVRTYYQKQMAQEAVRRLDGVDEVDNQLEVEWV